MGMATSGRVVVRRVLVGAAVVGAAMGTTVLASAGTPSAPQVTGSPPAAADPEREVTSAPVASAAQRRSRKFPYATTSSQITLNRNGRLLWVVNPGADTVSVIRTDTNRVVRTIRVGDEPQSIAVDPNDRYAFTANAAAGTVSVIRITNSSRSNFRA